MKQVLVALIVITFASNAMAQGPGGRRGVVGLLAMEEVQTELSLTAAQKEKFDALRSQRGEQQNLSREERQKRAEELQRKADETVRTVLDEKQQHRLAELRLQREGASALGRPEVAAQMGLDQAQKDQIKKIESENTPADRTNARELSQTEREQQMAAARERREKTNAAILVVLTPRQQEAFEKMQGSKFNFPQRRRQGQ